MKESKSEAANQDGSPALASATLLGRCVEAGDNESGIPRILIHTTRQELMKGRNIVFQDCVVIRAAEHTDAMRLAGAILSLLTDVAQLLDGWHADGTAWSEWDESVRLRVSETQRKLYDLVQSNDES